MNEEYGIFEEPSAVDAIILDATEKIGEFLREDVKKTIQEANDAEGRLIVANTELRAKQSTIDYLDEQIRRRQEQLDKIDQYHLPRGFAKNLVTALTGGFAPEDKCWMVYAQYLDDPCPLCRKKGKVKAVVEGLGEVDVECPVCNGRKSKACFSYVPKEVTVKEVILKVCIERGRVGVWSYNTICIYGDKDNAHKPEDFYKTLEECQVACDEMNEREKRK